jgi:hypothetical protein
VQHWLKLNKLSWHTWKEDLKAATWKNPATFFRPALSFLILLVLTLLGLSQMPSALARNNRESAEALATGFLGQLLLVAPLALRIGIVPALLMAFVMTAGRFMGRFPLLWSLVGVAGGVGLGLLGGVSTPVLWIVSVSFLIIRWLSANASRYRSVPSAKLLLGEVLHQHMDFVEKLAAQSFPDQELQREMWETVLTADEKAMLLKEFGHGSKEASGEDVAVIAAALHAEAVAYRNENNAKSEEDPEKLSKEDIKSRLALRLVPVLPLWRRNAQVMNSFLTANMLSANKSESEALKFAFLIHMTNDIELLIPKRMQGVKELINQVGGLKSPKVRAALYDIFASSILPQIKSETGDDLEHFLTTLSEDVDVRTALRQYAQSLAKGHIDHDARQKAVDTFVSILSQRATKVDEIEMDGYKLSLPSLARKEREDEMPTLDSEASEDKIKEAVDRARGFSFERIAIRLLRDIMWRPQTVSERKKIAWGAPVPAVTISNLMQVWLRDHWQTIAQIFERVPWDVDLGPNGNMLKTIEAGHLQDELYAMAPDELRAAFDLIFDPSKDNPAEKFSQELVRQWASGGYLAKSQKKYELDVRALHDDILNTSSSDLTAAINDWRREFNRLSAIGVENGFDAVDLKGVADLAQSKGPQLQLKAGWGTLLQAEWNVKVRNLQGRVGVLYLGFDRLKTSLHQGQNIVLDQALALLGNWGILGVLKRHQMAFAWGALAAMIGGFYLISPNIDIFNHMMSHDSVTKFFNALLLVGGYGVATIAAGEVVWGPRRTARAASPHAAFYFYFIGILYAFVGWAIGQHDPAMILIMVLGFSGVMGRLIGSVIGSVTRFVLHPRALLILLIPTLSSLYVFDRPVFNLLRTYSWHNGLALILLTMAGMYLSWFYRHSDIEFWRKNPLEAGARMGDVRREWVAYWTQQEAEANVPSENSGDQVDSNDSIAPALLGPALYLAYPHSPFAGFIGIATFAWLVYQYYKRFGLPFASSTARRRITSSA